MKIRSISTPTVCIGDDIFAILKASLPIIKERMIVAVSAKIISLCEGAVVDMHAITKEALVQQESDLCVYSEQHDLYLTKTQGVFLPSAGIDESNAQGHYVLYPRDLLSSTNALGEWLKESYGVRDLGVIVVDSRSMPLRRGVIGMGLCWYGFHPLYHYAGQVDCFGRPLRKTCVNLVDALAVSAVVCMGEGDEHTPIALIEEAPKITFHSACTQPEDLSSIRIDPSEDIYASMAMLLREHNPRG